MKDGSYYFGWEVHAFSRNHHVVLSENFLLFFSLLGGCLVLQHVLENGCKIKYLPGAIATMLVSMVVGGVIRACLPHDEDFSPLVIGFSSDILYFGLLPPIIFNSAYHLRRRLFFGNMGAVFSLAVVGTCVTTALTALGINVIQYYGSQFGVNIEFSFMERIAFACALSATDPVSTLAVFSSLKVDPTLYYAMLGESVLNDAVAITAFRASSRLIGATNITYLDGVACVVNFVVLLVGSSIIGYGTGVLAAWGLKYVHFGRDRVIPMGVVVCTMYIPFFLAEMFQLSGIVAIFFAGIAARRYVHKNLTLEVRKLAAFVFHLLSHCSETTCFVLLGLSVFLVDFPWQQLPFMLLVLAVCLLARPAAVYPLLGLLNVYRRHPTTPDATPSAGSPSPTSPPRSARSRDYGAVPTVEENLETGGPAQRAAADFSERLVRPRAVSDASSGSTRPPSLLHERIAGDSGLRLQEPDLDLQRASTDASDSTLNVYDAAADAPTARLPLAQPISAANMHVIAFAGMRGAVSFSLAYIFPDTHGNRDLVLCTAIVVVLFTSFFQGCLTEPLIRWLNITTDVDIADYIKTRAPVADKPGFERNVLYPLILKPRIAPYHHHKRPHDKDVLFAPICGPCGRPDEHTLHPDNVPTSGGGEGVSVSSGAHGDGEHSSDRAPHSASKLTSLSLSSIGVTLHNFFYDKGFARASGSHRAGKMYDDTLSSGGGSLISSEDHRIAAFSPEPALPPRSTPHSLPSQDAARSFTHPPLHRRPGSNAGEPWKLGLSTFSPAARPFSLRLTKSAPGANFVSAAKASVPSEKENGSTSHNLEVVMRELKDVIAQRNPSTAGATSPPPLSGGVSGPEASVFNHLTAPNPYYSPLVSALFPDSPPHGVASSPAPVAHTPTWRTVRQVHFTPSTDRLSTLTVRTTEHPPSTGARSVYHANATGTISDHRGAVFGPAATQREREAAGSRSTTPTTAGSQESEWEFKSVDESG